MSKFSGIDLRPILEEIDSQSSAFSLEFSKIVYEKYINARSINELHRVETGVKKGDKIPLADKGRNYNYMKSKEGLTSQCDFNECEINVKFSTKKWDTHAYNCEVKLCLKDLTRDFTEYWGLKCKDLDPKSESDVKNAFIDFLIDWVSEALVASHWVKAWFVSASYPTTSGLYGADALFTQMLGIAQVGSTQRIEIPENKNNDYATQLALDPERGYEVFSALRKKALKSRTLRGRKKELVILTTEDLAINYQEYLEDNNQVKCCYKADTTTENYDIDKLNIFGIPIKVMPEWDDIIQGADTEGNPYFNELNNGTKFTSPHRAVVTYKDNLPVGTCNSDKLDEVEVLYNKHDRRLSIRSEYDLGSNVLIDKDFIIAV